MGARALLDLSEVIVWGAAFALASLAYYIAKAVAAPLNVSILGQHPFRFIQDAIESAIVEPLNDIRAASDKKMSEGIRGIVDSLILMVGLVLVLGDGVKLALQYLWKVALLPLIHTVTNPVRALADKALAKAQAVLTDLVTDVGRLDQRITDTATHTYDRATSYADRAARDAEHLAESYADTAVAKLRAAEDTALEKASAALHVSIAGAEAVASRAVTAAEAEFRAGLTEAEQLAARAVGTAEAEAAAALAKADALGKEALAGVKAIAVTAEDDLNALVGKLGIAGAAGLIASIPLLATLVNTVVTEAGLGDASCRAKNKQICGVDAAGWETLLAGIAAVAVGFNLKDIVEAASGVVSEAAPLIHDLAA